jgi:3-oxoacyl-[acyl-carrier-protein] synthase II
MASPTPRGAIAITGLGAVSSLGLGAPALRDAIFRGRDGLAPVERFDTAPFAPVSLGGCVSEGSSCVEWAIAAAREAWTQARAGDAGVAPERIAVVAGTTEGEESDIPGIARAVAAALGARGPQWTVSTACTSSANAIGLGADLLDRGDADLVIAGGAERLVEAMYAGFYRLGVLATEKCAPFGETRGTTLGEGAGFVVLERAGARAVPAWAFLEGYGLASDAWHETTPEPRGAGIARAMRGALADAGLAAEAIDYVNVHGTGTATNDDGEWRGVRTALGDRAEAIPLSATKSFLGHAQGAAGVLELIATLVCAREGTIPPTLRVGRGRPNGPPDPVTGDAPRPCVMRHALSNSAAFGGANAVLAIGMEPRPRPARSRIVRVIGVGEARDETNLGGLAVDLKNTDPSCRLALGAAARGLADANVRVSGALRERIGIFAGATRVSPTSLAEYRESIERAGIARPSAAAFSRLVLHAPAGAVSRLLALRGPTTSLAADGIAGIMAFAYAADTLARRDDADLMLAVGFDEHTEDEPSEEDGAASAVLAAGDGEGPRVVGVASAGPEGIERAIDAALARASIALGTIGRADVDAWFRSEAPHASAPSLGSVLLPIRATLAVRAGARVAVAAAAGPTACCAVVIARGLLANDTEH